MRLRRRQLAVLERSGEFRRAGTGAGRRFSRQAAASDRAVHARRHDRHPGARDRGQAAGRVRPELHRREPAGRRRHLGCEMVARADPDGLTMLMGHIGTLAINPLVYPHHGYDPVKGWTPLAYVANVPNVLAVNAVGAGPVGPGAGGAGQGEARRAGLRHRRHGQRLASRLGLFRLRHRHRVPARALQGHGAVRLRPFGRSAADGLHRCAGGHAARQAGPPAGARRLERQAVGGVSRTADHRRVGLSRLRGRPMVRHYRAGRHRSRDRGRSTPRSTRRWRRPT